MEENNLKLLDKSFAEISEGLLSELPWLNNAFGRAERTVKLENGRRLYLPAIYKDGNFYRYVTPGQEDRNFSFFWVNDPQVVNWQPRIQNQITCQFSLIFWFNYNDIYQSHNIRNKEEVKDQILKALNGGFTISYGQYTIERIYELAENIYEGFNLDEIDNQFLMHPFGGFRFAGEIKVLQPCRY